MSKPGASSSFAIFGAQLANWLSAIMKVLEAAALVMDLLRFHSAL